MSDFTFKQIDKNEYETFMEGKSLNIFFKIPDECKIEDYNIEKTEETPTLVGSPSKAAYFEFVKAPDEGTANFISPLAGLNFLNKSYIKIEDFLSLGDNKEVNIDLKDGASPCFQGFDFANNRDSTFIFTPSSFKKVSEEELNKVAFHSSGISTIEGNANLTLTLGDKIDRVVIDNSILEGDNVLYNVSELTCSEVRDSELDLKEPAKISNHLLSFEDIDDYEAYQRAQEPKLEEIKKDVGQITTEDWEVL